MNVKFDFSDKRFVVTGASSGIGREIVKELVEAGAIVLAIARRAQNLQELQNEYPKNIIIAAIDVTDSEQLEIAITSFATDGKISGSVHAAGINQFTPLKMFRKSDAQKILDTNLFAGIELIKILSRKRISASDASHVQIASVSGIQGQAGLSAYSASKSAIIGVVRSLALELASQGIRLNAVSPGWTETDMARKIEEVYPNVVVDMKQKHPLGLGKTTDVAGVVLFLLSDRARWITGSNIVVDGGFLA
jgi:NAD(P)-dependent dehydrogenase (short-subunit alcohol dehydrogenase family)